MSAPTMTPQTVKPRRTAEPSVREIIAKGRSVPKRVPVRGAFVCAGSTAVLLWASFTPLDWGPLGWIALVPLILLVRLKERTRLMYPAVYGCGLIHMLATLQWMRLGHAAMYPAWILLSIYLAVYFPLFVGLSRAAVHRLAVPLTLAVPTVWVGLEFARAQLMTGFPWYFLGHTQYRWIELIQISDLVGVYGVSFVVALIAACLAGLVPPAVFARLRLLPRDDGRQTTFADPAAVSRRLLGGSRGLRHQAVTVGMSLTVFAAVVGYGYWRRAEADFQPGPRVALIQGNFTSTVKHNPSEWDDIFLKHEELTGKAVRHQPEIIIWPETMFRWPLLIAPPEMSQAELQRAAPRVPPQMWKNPEVRRALREMSQQAGAAMILGLDSLVAKQDDASRYNSAVFVRPDVGIAGRYDKLHRVIFGEYLPLKEQLPWLHKLTPFPADYGIDAGDGAAVFEYKGWRLSPMICYEDTVPSLIRRIVRSTNRGEQRAESGEHAAEGEPVDCLVNLTNDGWFHGSSELDQHLITSLFRCVETRTPMVRAVNTGISAVIDGDGVVVEPDVFIDGDGQGRDSMRDPETGDWHKQLNAALVDTVPLDARQSLYVQWGDWFAALCGLGCVVFAAGGVVRQGRFSGGATPRTLSASGDARPLND